MKRTTCKVLIWIALIWLFITSLYPLYMLLASNFMRIIEAISIFIFLIFTMGIPSWILLIIAWAKWNSEESKERKKEIHKAQLETLKKGKVNVEMKGRMRKLK